jgi:alkanesulfonate monooxygenase SsuD/methylene tetrahydromethanopterin reductase-like flavin-dependent oxidoreductase (luciferase family)
LVDLRVRVYGADLRDSWSITLLVITASSSTSAGVTIWLGTFGDRALAVTGRLGDGWLPSLGYAPDDQLPVMRAKVLAAARAAGRSPDDITCALNLEVHLGTDADPRPGLVTGTAEQVITRLRDFISAGFTAFNFMPVGASIREQTERIGLEVAPNLRLR